MSTLECVRRAPELTIEMARLPCVLATVRPEFNVVPTVAAAYGSKAWVAASVSMVTSINVESTTVVNFSPAAVDACQDSNNLR
jgi:hypothetical protein